jgi:phospholipase C
MSLRRVWPVLAVVAALLVPGAPQAAAAPPTGLEGVPHFDHVVVLTEENEDATKTFGADSPAVYLKSLRSQGVFLPNYYGTGHVSLDNYIAMVSGQPMNPLTASDCASASLWSCAQEQTALASGRNLGDQLDEAKLSWTSYQDGAATPCFHGPYAAGDPSPDPYQGNSTTGAKNYADRHVPFLYFPNVIGDQARCASHLRPFPELAADLKSGLPAFSFITPDTCNDGHDNPCAGQSIGGLTAADAWLQTNLPPLLHYLAAHNGLLVINFDEGSVPPSPADIAATPTDYSCPTCASLGFGGRTAAVLISPRLPQGKTVMTSYDHHSLLRTIEDSFGIAEHLNLAGAATAMSDAFVGTRP